MPFIHMVMADRDEEYVQRLTQWLRENRPQQFQVSAFTEKESFYRFLQESDQEIDVLLVSEHYLNPDLRKKNNLIVLGETSLEPNLPTVEKYQTASALCTAILSLVSQWHHQLPRYGNAGKSDIVVCFSTDTWLKSILALWLAAISSSHVYINLEAFPFYLPDPLTQSNRSLSDILYHIKANKGNIPIALESAVCTDKTGIHFLPPMDNPKDLWELTDTENALLIESFFSWGRFSRVIADIELCTSPKTIQWFEAASCLLIPFTTKDMNRVNRLNKMLLSLSDVKYEKIRWVVAEEDTSEHHEMILNALGDLSDHLFFLPWLTVSPLDMGTQGLYGQTLHGQALDAQTMNEQTYGQLQALLEV